MNVGERGMLSTGASRCHFTFPSRKTGPEKKKKGRKKRKKGETRKETVAPLSYSKQHSE